MSWGIRITILYVGFVALIGTMVYLSMRQNVDLVSADYYQKELDFQNQLDRMNESKKLTTQPEVKAGADQVSILFPAEFRNQPISGNVHFYRAADASRDFQIDIAADTSGLQKIANDKFVSGAYTVKINWTAAGKNYYNESPLYIP
jgi:hypothetical protein